jgi:ABC-type antimicrobial peptide transport system permease subunit
VGLAPVHISFLFLAEACVYAVLGVVFGYILGQGTSKVLIGLDMLSGVSVNYSSMAAVVSAIIVIAVVLLSAIYPAVAASRMPYRTWCVVGRFPHLMPMSGVSSSLSR